MSSTVVELNRVVESLPEETARQVLDFARFLQRGTHRARRTAKPNDDDQWEARLAETTSRPKLVARLRRVDAQIAAGAARPLDFSAR